MGCPFQNLMNFTEFSLLCSSVLSWHLSLVFLLVGLFPLGSVTAGMNCSMSTSSILDWFWWLLVTPCLGSNFQHKFFNFLESHFQLGTAGPPITTSSSHLSSPDAAVLHEAGVLEAACKAFYCACMSPLLILTILMQLDLKKKSFTALLKGSQ